MPGAVDEADAAFADDVVDNRAPKRYCSIFPTKGRKLREKSVDLRTLPLAVRTVVDELEVAGSRSGRPAVITWFDSPRPATRACRRDIASAGGPSQPFDDVVGPRRKVVTKRVRLCHPGSRRRGRAFLDAQEQVTLSECDTCAPWVEPNSCGGQPRAARPAPQLVGRHGEQVFAPLRRLARRVEACGDRVSGTSRAIPYGRDHAGRIADSTPTGESIKARAGWKRAAGLNGEREAVSRVEP